MAYFSKLGKGNVVEEVYVINDDIATSEQAGIDFIHNLYNINSVIKQTFIDGSQRKNYGGVGYKYDQTRDAFIPPRVFLSWVLNETTCKWEPPVAKPQDGKIYIWNETTKQWDLNE
jgi:hypothetical protein